MTNLSFCCHKKVRLVEYFLENPQNIYFCHGYDDTLDLYNPKRRNYTGWGGWISETLDWKTMITGEYDNIWEAIAYRSELRFVISEHGINLLEDHLREKGYHCRPVCEEVDIEGKIYRIWKFESEM